MGTRNLVGVIYNNEWRVAQYGQWDGYPEGQGATVLAALADDGVEKLREKIELCHFIGSDKITSIRSGLSEEEFLAQYPQFNRDTGADILNIIKATTMPIDLVDNKDFIKDTWCEFAYIVDLDDDVLLCYADGEHLWGRYRFDDLPTVAELCNQYDKWVNMHS